MPVYPYSCFDHGTHEIFKPMSEASRHEYCACGALMTRIYTAPGTVLTCAANNSIWKEKIAQGYPSWAVKD